VARALASLISMKAGWFPVVVTRDDRARYIEALETADEGDLRPLISFLVDVQRRALFQAVQVVADVQQAHTVEEAIAAAKRLLTQDKPTPPLWSKAKESADYLMTIAQKRLQEVGGLLQKEMRERLPDFSFHIDETGAAYLVGLPYSANTFDYGAVRSLHIITDHPSVIQVHAHAAGTPFRGLIGIVAMFKRDPLTTQLMSPEPFQVNYAEPLDHAERRFRPWLEQSLINALTWWRKSL